MALSNTDVGREISSLLKKIEKGSPKALNCLNAFLAMNGLDCGKLTDKVEIAATIGSFAESERICKKYSSYIFSDVKKNLYQCNDFASNEISRFSDMVSDKHRCERFVFYDIERLDSFLFARPDIYFHGIRPATLIYHNKGNVNFSEFVSFKKNKVFAGGFANNWEPESFKLHLFGSGDLVSSYCKELFSDGLQRLNRFSYARVNDYNLNGFPLIDRVLKSIKSVSGK